MIFIIISIICNFINYDYFNIFQSFAWSIASILIIYSAIKYTIRYRGVQFRIRKIIGSLRSKSKNNISPLSSLSISLAAKIGVGSLSGVALTLYFGGLGSMFWLCLISLLVSVNTYVECILGIKYRDKLGKNYLGGPSYYIKKCLGNKWLSRLYGILIIITYSGLFLSIQSNTIVATLSSFEIDKSLVVFILSLVTFLIIWKGIGNISFVNSILVPVMLIFYLVLGIYVTYNNFSSLGGILKNVIVSAFNIKSIIPVFIIGMQRAIFITESSIGTSAMSASLCDNEASKQGTLEVLGIHITTFLVCVTTFLIIVTSNYLNINFENINGIEIVMYAFNYHFGTKGMLILSIITCMFAFSTIISSYFFGENNLKVFNVKGNIIYKIIFILIIVISGYVNPTMLWNLTDYFIAILSIINVSSILRIKN